MGVKILVTVGIFDDDSISIVDIGIGNVVNLEEVEGLQGDLGSWRCWIIYFFDWCIYKLVNYEVIET